MSDEWLTYDGVYTPSDVAIVSCYVRMRVADGISEDEANAEFNRWQGDRDGKVISLATLATVRPNPDDARQVEVVARALHSRIFVEGHDPRACTHPDHWTAWSDDARAVLAALAEAVA